MKYAFYPGCSLESSAKEYKESTLLVAKALGIDMEEIQDWICCGSTPAHMADTMLSTALPSYSLLLARQMETDGVLVSCASCYSRLKAANHAIRSGRIPRDKLARVLGEHYEGDVPVYHMLEAVTEALGGAGFEGAVRQRLEGLRVASYYGCLLVRPEEITGFDDREDPQSLDRIVEAVGGVPVDWRYKVECCGAALAFSQPQIVQRLSGRILEDAKECGADVVVVACPLCHSNLDLRQPDSERFLGIDLEVPVLYFTQLLGLALGFSGGELGLGKNVVSPIPTLKKRGIRL